MRWLSNLAFGGAVLAAAACSSSPRAAVIAPPAPVAAVAAPVLISAAPSEVVARAARLVAEQPGYRYSFELSLRGLPEAAGAGPSTSSGRGFSLGGAGAVNQRAERSALNLDLRGLRELLLATGEATAEELDEFLGDGRVDVVADGETFYVRMPFLAKQARVTTPWVAAQAPAGTFPDGGMGGMGGLGAFGALGGLGNLGAPTDYLEQLKALDPTVTAGGSEVVRGTATTRYSGSLDIARLLGGASSTRTPEEQAQFEAMAPFLQAFRLPYEVWIDGDGLPRRLTTTLDFGAFAPGGTGEAPGLAFSYELFDYGAPGEIRVPAASEFTLVDPSTLEFPG